MIYTKLFGGISVSKTNSSDVVINHNRFCSLSSKSPVPWIKPVVMSENAFGFGQLKIEEQFKGMTELELLPVYDANFTNMDTVLVIYLFKQSVLIYFAPL